MQTLYCSDTGERSRVIAPDMFSGVNDSWLTNGTDMEHQWSTADPDDGPIVERRVTETVYLLVRYHVYKSITPVIMLAGVIGNVISLLFGVRCRRQMSSLERSASAGLVALVLSDLLFCAVGLPQLFVPKRSNPTAPADNVPIARFRFYYELYRGPLHNVFLLCSTWIVAIITAERYLAVSQPIRARLLTIRLRRTLIFYVAVFVLSWVVTLPLFLRSHAVEGDCFPGCRCIYVFPTTTFGSVKARRVHSIVWLVVGVLLPLGCLLVAGTKLLKALRALRRRNEIVLLRQDHLERQQHSRPSPVTITVVGTAVSFILLVCPSLVVYSFEVTSASSKILARFNAGRGHALCSIDDELKRHIYWSVRQLFSSQLDWS